MAYKGDETKELQDGFEMADVQNDEVDLEMMDEGSVQDDGGSGFQDTKEAGETQNYDVVIGKGKGIVRDEDIGKDEETVTGEEIAKDEDIVKDEETVTGEEIAKDEDIGKDEETVMGAGIGNDEGNGRGEETGMDEGTGMDGGIVMDERVSLDKTLDQVDFE